MVKVAINGFGKIGQNALKIAFARRDVEVVAINSLLDLKTSAHLLKFDSPYGAYASPVSTENNLLIVNNKKILFFSEKNPENLPWKKLGVDVVIEEIEENTDPEKVEAHLKAGAKKVIIASSSKSENLKTIVIGVNEEILNSSDKIISCSSPATNCEALVLKLLEENLGIEKVSSTVFSPRPDPIVSKIIPEKNLREFRSYASNLIPSPNTPGNIDSIIPSLAGKFTNSTFYVPTETVSMIDITAITKKNTTREEVEKIFKKASEEPFFEGILDVSEDELVSSDFRGNSHSCIIDLSLISVTNENLVKVIAWLDNEWGYTNRLIELTVDFGKGKHD